jgi:spore coat polysaccharide biosynthesis protein SpsF
MYKPNKVSAIIQARMGSQRLPGKVLLRIIGKSVISHIINRLGFCKQIDEVILAVPDTKDNDILEKFAVENSIKYYRGSENDVLERFYLAAKENNCDVIVEVTGDKPLIDPNIVDLAIKRHLKENGNNKFTHYIPDSLPIGLDAGIIDFGVLKTAHENAKKNYQREHITSYFYENPDIFKIISIKPPKTLKNPGLRLTLDTIEDFKLINKIYSDLYNKGEIFQSREIFKLIEKQPELKKINSHIIQRTVKIC